MKSIKEMHEEYKLTLRPIKVRNGLWVGYGEKYE